MHNMQINKKNAFPMGYRAIPMGWTATSLCASNPNHVDKCILATASLCAENRPEVRCTYPVGVNDGTIAEHKLATTV